MSYHLSYAKYSIHVILSLLTLLSPTYAQSVTECAGTECQSTSIQSGQISCNGPNSCQESTLTSDDAEYGFIECTGFESCYETASISSATDVYCSGSNSCQLSNSIDATNIYCAGSTGCARAKLSASGNVYCYSQYGCSGTRINADADTFCSGQSSCYNSFITNGKSANCEANEGCFGARITNANKVGCMGTQSCRRAVISTANSVRGYGYQSMYFTEISGSSSVRGWGYQSLTETIVDSQGLSRMTVEIYTDSYQSQVICRSGSTCTVSCKGTGCGGITYVCLSGATCNVSPGGCVSDNSVADINGETCPTFTDTLSLEIFTDEADEDYEFDEFDEFDDGAIIKADCVRCNDCNAKGECATLAATQGATTRCKGEASCFDAAFSDTAVACEGSRSCAKDIFGNDGKENTFCNGFQSCLNSEGSIGETGFVGFEYFPCSGEFACAVASLQPHGDTSCKGAYSCTRAVINVTEYATVNIEGWQAANRAYIGGMLRVVNVYGYAALAAGVIDTEWLIPRQEEVPEITVNSFGHLSGFGGTVICRAGRECTVNCKSTGCQMLDFVCENGAICNVNPVECKNGNVYRGVDCPKRSNTADADQYMDRKYEMQQDVYERFDAYLDDIMENERLEYDDYEDIMMFMEREMIFAQEQVIDNYSYNNVDNIPVRLVECIFILMGLSCLLWYILIRKQNKDNDYIAIN